MRSSAARAWSAGELHRLEEIEGYAEAHTTDTRPAAPPGGRDARATLERPQMLTGTIEGRFLEFLVLALQAERVLELGISALTQRDLDGGGAAERRGTSTPARSTSTMRKAVAQRYIEEAGYATASRSTLSRARNARIAPTATSTSSSSTRTRRTTAGITTHSFRACRSAG